MFKKELRKLFLQKRLQLSPEEVTDLSLKIKVQFDEFLPSNVETVHIFLPIISKNEVDTRPIIHGLWERNIKTFVPVMNKDNLGFESFLFNDKTRLSENIWGIPEPIDHLATDEQTIDAVVLPMLACDLKGNRVGYGKGMYDTFLPALKKDTLKIGLSFFLPVDHIEDTSSADVPLDYCICPDQVIKF
jgi:5-formyltetrahydrofolate cyclo-ligase